MEDEGGYMIEAVVFDMDGVLFDTERIIGECWKKVASEIGIDGIEDLLNACIGSNKKATRTIFLERLGEDFDFDYFDTQAHNTFLQKVEEEGLPIKLGVRELLEYLQQAGIRIGLASSTYEAGVRSHLKRVGLESYFEVIIGGDMVKASKPDPEIYLTACKELGVKPEHAIAIEDSYNGVRSASAAKLLTIMVPDLLPATEEIEALLYKKCDSLLEVMKYL